MDVDLPVSELRVLLNQIAAGDDKAVTRIYVHYQRYLFGFIKTKVSDDAAAEEILQDTLMVLFSKPQSFQWQSKFSTWLYAIAQNKIVDWWRGQGRHRNVAEESEEILASIPDESWDATAAIESEQMSSLLKQCLDCLSTVQREAIFLASFNDASVGEIAIQQKCPVNTVKTRLFHARLLLKKCVEGRLGKETRNG